MTATHTVTIRRMRTGSRGVVSRAECSCGYFGSNGTKREAEADERRHLHEVRARGPYVDPETGLVVG